MRITKISHKNACTYLVIHAEQSPEYTTITLHGQYEAESNKDGTAITIKKINQDQLSD